MCFWMMTLVYCAQSVFISVMFKRKSNLSAPRLQVVRSEPWRKPVVISMLAIIGVCCILLGFALGQNQVLVNRVSNALLSKDLDETQSQLAQMQGELIDARLNAQVAGDAADALRQDLAAMQADNQKLAEEVTFYKSLMDPGSLTQGLQITELELARGSSAAEFDFQLLLTQVAQRRSFIAGDVRIDIVGTQENETSEVVLSLTEIADIPKYPLKFRFRYFQDLTGSLTLPDRFVPQRILITAQQQGKQAQQESFPWPDWTGDNA